MTTAEQAAAQKEQVALLIDLTLAGRDQDAQAVAGLSPEEFAAAAKEPDNKGNDPKA